MHAVVTSPPYWGLRNYGHWSVQSTWEGHDWSHFPDSRRYRGETHQFMLKWRAAERGGVWCREGCCWIGALGAEPDVDMFVDHLVAIFRDVRRVLRDDGTAWLVLGDSYARNGGVGRGRTSALKHLGDVQKRMTRIPKGSNLKPKDVVGQPWRVAFALQMDGWILRRPIIWAKKNPMPQSVRDRPTSSYEFIFMLSKQGKYFYDAEAVRQQSGANLRDVWHIPTRAFPGAHFATFPEEIPARCIKAGTSEYGVCSDCGAPWVRQVHVKVGKAKMTPKTIAAHRARGGKGIPVGTVGKAGSSRVDPVRTTTGWKPSCECDAERVGAVVLDPFVGSGTTLAMAQKLGRRSVGVDFNGEYLELAEKELGEFPLQMLL